MATSINNGSKKADQSNISERKVSDNDISVRETSSLTTANTNSRIELTDKDPVAASKLGFAFSSRCFMDR